MSGSSNRRTGTHSVSHSGASQPGRLDRSRRTGNARGRLTGVARFATFVAAFLVLPLVLAACAKPVQNQAQPSLADQLAGENRTVTQEARGIIVSLPGILFDFDKATLREETMSTLQQVADVLQQYPDLEIRVEGHTDDVGAESYNQDLSERRALSVFEFLVGAGISDKQVTHAGFGETLPVAGNDTPEGRQRNRRVDIVIPDPPQ